MANELFFRRGNRERLPPLKTGEPALCSDTQEVFVGCGKDTIQLETVPDCELVTLTHNLNNYPNVLLLAGRYTAGAGGAGDGPAGGEELTQYPCRQTYQDANNLTVYTVKKIAGLGTPTINKISDYVYTLTYSGTDSLYIKLLLNI